MADPLERGSAEQIRHLYSELGPALLGYASLILKNRSAAEDVLHQVFLKFLEGRVPLPREPRPYLFRAIGNAALNHRRGELRETARREELQLFETSTGMESSAAELDAAIAELPEEQQQIVFLKVWGEMTFEEVAQLLGISSNTAATRYRLALAKLRARLASLGRR